MLRSPTTTTSPHAPARSCPLRPSLWLRGKRASPDWEDALEVLLLKSRGIHCASRHRFTTGTSHTTMKTPSTALLRTFSPLWRSKAPVATVRGCLAQQQQQRADFSSTSANQARDKRNKKDPRISMFAVFGGVGHVRRRQQTNHPRSANQIPLRTPSHTSTSALLSVSGLLETPNTSVAEC